MAIIQIEELFIHWTQSSILQNIYSTPTLTIVLQYGEEHLNIILTEIYRLQKRAVKIIVNYQYDNIANSMGELKILNIYERIFLRKAKFMFKVSKSVLPSYVNEMFSFRPFNETLQSLRSTGALDFYTPRRQKEIFQTKLNLFRSSHLEQFTRLFKEFRNFRLFS